MITTTLIFVICWVIFIKITHASNRPFYFVLGISVVYYGIVAPQMWLSFEDGQFMGVDWTAGIYRSSSLLIFSALGWMLSVEAMDLWSAIKNTRLGKVRPLQVHVFSPETDSILTPTQISRMWIIGTLGFVGAIYVFLRILLGSVSSDDPALKIAYQFGDLLIPLIIFCVAARINSNIQISLIVLFFVYAISVGFRYKLALLVAPILVMHILVSVHSQGRAGLRKALRDGIFVLLALAVLFSAMTIARQKFGALRIDELKASDRTNFLYGFYAEGNTIFGLASILENFVDMDKLIYLRPIYDAALELIPKFLAPWRETGLYLEDVLLGMHASEATGSATAYPYIGEMLLAFGYSGLVIGTLLIAAWYRATLALVIKYSGSIRLGAAGIGILATYFGYYYFSRGYFPQSLKGYLFVVLPYIYLLDANREKSIVT